MVCLFGEASSEFMAYKSKACPFVSKIASLVIMGPTKL